MFRDEREKTLPLAASLLVFHFGSAWGSVGRSRFAFWPLTLKKEKDVESGAVAVAAVAVVVGVTLVFSGGT